MAFILPVISVTSNDYLYIYVFFLKIQLFSAIMNKGIICPEAGKKYFPLFLHVTARPAVTQIAAGLCNGMKTRLELEQCW
jgi:hypothetical protein